MRLGQKKRIYIRNRCSQGKCSFLILILVFFALCFFAMAYFLRVARPLMIELAGNQASVLAEQTMHKAINNLFSRENWSDIIHIARLEDGTVSSLEAEMSNVNRLKAQAAMDIQEAVAAIDSAALQLPLGTLTGYDLLAGVGPRLKVQLMPYGRVLVDFKSSFEAMGVNQTRLTVSLEAKTNVGIVLSTAQISREVVTEIPVQQTIIVGKVPDNYVNIDRMGEAFEGDVLDIIG